MICFRNFVVRFLDQIWKGPWTCPDSPCPDGSKVWGPLELFGINSVSKLFKKIIFWRRILRGLFPYLILNCKSFNIIVYEFTEKNCKMSHFKWLQFFVLRTSGSSRASMSTLMSGQPRPADPQSHSIRRLTDSDLCEIIFSAKFCKYDRDSYLIESVQFFV